MGGEFLDACLMIESPQPETAEPIATMRTFAGFVTMCIGMFMAILDVQIVATSLPTIQRALGIAPDEMSWVQTAYLIAEIVAIPLTGFLMRPDRHAPPVRCGGSGVRTGVRWAAP